jgi:PAS domain S-box-containing protein
MENSPGNSTEPTNNILDLSLLNNIPNPVIITNQDLCIRWVNRDFEQLTRFSKTEVEGAQAPYPWWPKARHEEYLEELKAIREGRKHKTDWLFESKTGSPFWVKAAATPIKEDGAVKNMLAVWADITENKVMEELLQTKLINLRESCRQILETIENVVPNGITLQQKIHSIYEIMVEAENRLKEIASGRNLQILIPAGLPSVYIDKALITLALMSLAAKVVESPDKGSPVIIRAGETGEGVKISILTATAAEKADTEWAKVDEASLKLSSGIIEAHGGQLEVIGAAGGISGVSFTVPKVGVG